MKNIILPVVSACLFLVGCNENNSTSILKDDQLRGKIYQELLTNHNYLKEFLDSMRTNEHAVMMFNADTAMVDKMLSDMPVEKMLKQLLTRSEKDSMTCKMMCGAMMDHKKVMKTMLQTLNKSGVVGNDCMEKMKSAKSPKTAAAPHH